jgi:phage terminase small subunit
MKQPIVNGTGSKEVTADTPLTLLEQRFVTNYIKTGMVVQALKDCGTPLNSEDEYRELAYYLFRRPNIKAEIDRVMEEARKESVATAQEVMSYFTDVMRGDVKDQFGLDAPLSERTKAAQELAKRTFDLENRRAGNADQSIEIKLDWKR